MANRVYLYKGDEKYLTNAKIQRIIKESKADEINITTYDCSEVNLEKAIFDALTPAFLGGNKVVIITNPIFLSSEKNSNMHNTKILLSYLDKPSETTYLIINASGFKVNEKLEITKALLHKANVVTTNGISEVEFRGWLERECSIQNVRIEKNALSLMYKAFGSNLEETKNEVDKLTSYVGSGGVITETTLKELMSKGNNGDVYELVNALYKGEKEKAIKLYLELSKYQKDASFFINVISKSFKDNYLVKKMMEMKYNQSEISSKLNLNSNRVYYMMKDVSNITTEKMEKYIIKLADLDLRIKTGLIDKKIGFEEFLYRIE